MEKDVRFPKEHGGWVTVAVLPELALLSSSPAPAPASSALSSLVASTLRKSSSSSSKQSAWKLGNPFVCDDGASLTALGAYVDKYAACAVTCVDDAAKANMFL